VFGLLVCSEKTAITDKGEESISRILFLDDGTFELLSSFDLDYLEQGISITTCVFEGSNKPMIVVGTAQVVNDELEPSKGRVLIFEVNNNDNENGMNEKKVNLLTEKETKSGVYSVVSINGRLAAGIGSKVREKNLLLHVTIFFLSFFLCLLSLLVIFACYLCLLSLPNYFLIDSNLQVNYKR
jgi:hypothetical protein